jgi:phytoene dehydrogenase-like protein
MRLTIVGGGISGLTAAHLAAARGHDVMLLDAAADPGGLISSVRRDGFLCEHGPQAVLDGPAGTRALIDAAGLGDRPRRAAASSMSAAHCAPSPPARPRCSRRTCYRRARSCACSRSRSSAAPTRMNRCSRSSRGALGARRPSAPPRPR